MTRSEAIKAFFFKSVLPVTVALILYCIFKSACVKNGEVDYVWLWILCGLPFGLHRMCLWIVPGGGSLGGGIALFDRRCNRRFRSGLAAYCGGVVCAADGVPADRWMIFLHHGNMENFWVRAKNND